MRFSIKSFALGFGCAAISLGAVTYVSASSDKTIKACANKKTGAMRYIAKGACKKTETALSWNQNGPQGLPGSAGTNGTSGPKGDTGITGLKGDTGARGETGVAGASGNTGAVGSSFIALSICDGSDANSVADELCTIGMTGPGGGTVFFVDVEGRYSDFDYLEVAPTDASTAIAWSTMTYQCGLTLDKTCLTNFLTTSGEAMNSLAIGTGRSATAAIVARHNAGSVHKNLYAAGIADDYTTPTASDWFLPSKDELNELCKYALNNGQAAGPATVCEGGVLRSGFSRVYYWSSSEHLVDKAWGQNFDWGDQGFDYKSGPNFFVRPVRSF
jgi:hypothetical protein